MKMKHTPLAMLVVAALFASPANAQVQADHHSGDLAALGVADDPFAPVYIVTSRALYDKGIKTIARNGTGRRDSLGTGLVLAEIKAHQLSDLSRHVHESEKRCGGYFAFSSRAEADAFIVADRSLDATGSSFLASYTIDNQATVSPWLTTVSEGNIRTTIDHLSGYRNRYYTSSYGKASAEWIRSSWQQLAGSRTDVTTELFNCSNCSTQPSVILTVQGTDLPNEIVVLGAHLDSINGSANGSTEQVAPGADDDASGIATLTEVMRVALASGWKPRRTIKFMGYAAEEVGLRGSNAIAQSFKSANRNVVGVMQLDMTNYSRARWPTCSSSPTIPMRT